MHPEDEDEIVYHHNPMLEESRSKDTVPLLRRVDKVEHRTESIEAETRSMRQTRRRPTAWRKLRCKDRL